MATIRLDSITDRVLGYTPPPDQRRPKLKRSPAFMQKTTGQTNRLLSRHRIIITQVRARRLAPGALVQSESLLMQKTVVGLLSTKPHGAPSRAIANLTFSATFTYLMEEMGKIQTPSR